jgi:hypothetical protein
MRVLEALTPHLAWISEAFASTGRLSFSSGLRDSPRPIPGSSILVFFGKMFSLGCSVLSVKRAARGGRESGFQQRLGRSERGGGVGELGEGRKKGGWKED